MSLIRIFFYLFDFIMKNMKKKIIIKILYIFANYLIYKKIKMR